MQLPNTQVLTDYQEAYVFSVLMKAKIYRPGWQLFSLDKEDSTEQCTSDFEPAETECVHSDAQKGFKRF